MRILQLIDSLHPGGAERMAINIANALVGQVEVSALCCTREEGDLKDQLESGVRYLFADRKGRLGVRGIWRIIKFVKKHKLTHIHAHSSSIYIGFILKCIIPRLHLIWHDHYGNAGFVSQRSIRRYQWMSVKIDVIIAVNKQLQEWALDHKLSQKVVYLQNFIRPSSNKLVARKNFLETQSKTVICLANLRPQKNHKLLIKAWATLKTEYPDWELLLIGKKFQDEYQQMLIDLIKQYGLSQEVKLLGSVNNASVWMDKASIGVLSSSSEGLPLSLLEYGLAGLPVVVTDVGACREVVGNTSIVIPAGDLDQFTHALSRLMSNSALRSNLGQAFKGRVEAEFGEEKFLQSLLELYRSVHDKN
ncbi:glycosyltransferase family 4 protein [Nonlabens agnitus]|uniref:Glycosyl transferase n=1 Tax=Nonlabens agnitus TaxID=870484 RepID=A0A2S9WUG7_9FLAO|nr:glycosyltransferase family 4 protein [Nonlabens agnitus]PRP66976.1 hypothetical protein BST86_07630 [Nonlabens agnitus]